MKSMILYSRLIIVLKIEYYALPAFESSDIDDIAD